MRFLMRSLLVMLAFLGGVWACQEQGPPKPPESRIAAPAPRPGESAAGESADKDHAFKDREALRRQLMSRGLKEEEARAMAKSAILDSTSLEETSPPDDLHTREKTREEMKEEMRRNLESAGVPPEVIDSEVEAVFGQAFKPPVPPFEEDAGSAAAGGDSSSGSATARSRNFDSEQFRRNLETTGLPPDVIQQEIDAIVAPPDQPAASPPEAGPGSVEGGGDPTSASAVSGSRKLDLDQIRQSLEQAGLPPDIVQSEIQGFAPGSSLPPASQPEVGPGAAAGSDGSSSVSAARDPLKFDHEQFQKSLEKTGLPPDIVQREAEALTGNSGTPLQTTPKPAQ